MQDIQSIDRRPYNHHQGNTPPALKCPRCESLNTKFCYYNNYNLSQPRHFCKNCQRYWTKGGVLRNVPVGGGCRKKKRSKPKSGNRNPSSCSGVRKPSNSQNSSSDSSSFNTTTAMNIPTATETVTAAEVLSGINSANSKTTSVHINGGFDPPLVDHHSTGGNGNNIFAEIDTLTSLITSSTAQLQPEFNVFAGVSPFRLHHTGKIVENSNLDEQQWMLPTEFSGVIDKITDGGIGTEDWNNCTDQGLFDLTGTVDQSYWNQTQWDEDDHNRHDDDDDADVHNDVNYLR